MALNIKESVTVTGAVVIENVQVVYLSSNIVSDGSDATTFSQSILNADLYNANKAQCRADIAEFQKYVYGVEDRISAV
mgnify:FL=1